MGLNRTYNLRLRRKASQFPDNGYFRYLAGIPAPDLESRILVEIPAFRDPELIPTMSAAIAKAANPARIHFAVCYQGDDLDGLGRVRSFRNCRVKHFPEREAPGTCAARYEASRLWDGEEYVLHIDSHMRFASFWDVAVIDQYRRCPPGKHVVAEYCRNYAEWYRQPSDADVFDERARLGGKTVGILGFQSDGIKPRFTGKRDFPGPEPRLGAFICAHFIFGEPAMDEDVPIDPDMFFVSDEGSTALRLWTHGYDIYQPGVRCAYHLYARDAVAKKAGGTDVRRFASGSKSTEDRKKSEAVRTRQLYGVRDEGLDLGRFGAGTERSVDDYYKFAGVNYRSRSALMFAFSGSGFGTEHGPGDMAPASIAGENVADASHPMHGAASGRAWGAVIYVGVTACRAHEELELTVRSLFRNADNPSRVRVAVVAQEVEDRYLEPVRRLGAEIVPCGLLGAGNAHWTVEEHIPDDADYVLFSEEHMYYAPGWDLALAAYSEYCGDRAVISDWTPGFKPDDLPVAPWRGCLTAAVGVTGYGHLWVHFGRNIECGRPVRGAFLIGANRFVPAAVAREVRHDPEMWFQTDESYMTYRYWCAGVDIYHSPHRFCFHFYDNARSGGRNVVNDSERSVSRPRMKYFLGLSRDDAGADMRFRLGTARSLRSFEAFAGIDLASGKALMRANVCAFGDDTCAASLPDAPNCRKDGDRWAKADAVRGILGKPNDRPPSAAGPADVKTMEAACSGFVAPGLIKNGWDSMPYVRHDKSASISMCAGAGVFAKDGASLSVGPDCRIIMKDGSRLFVLGDFSLRCGAALRINRGACLVLGSGFMNENAKIDCAKHVHIGDAFISYDAYISDTDWHTIMDARGNVMNGDANVVFDGHVWIGEGATVLKGVRIGHGSVVGARSVVRHDVPAGCVVVGDPAKVIREGIRWTAGMPGADPAFVPRAPSSGY